MEGLRWQTRALFGFPLASTNSAGSEYSLADVYLFLNGILFVSSYLFLFYVGPVPRSTITGVFFLAVVPFLARDIFYQKFSVGGLVREGKALPLLLLGPFFIFVVSWLKCDNGCIRSTDNLSRGKTALVQLKELTGLNVYIFIDIITT